MLPYDRTYIINLIKSLDFKCIKNENATTLFHAKDERKNDVHQIKTSCRISISDGKFLVATVVEKVKYKSDEDFHVDDCQTVTFVDNELKNKLIGIKQNNEHD